MRKNGFNPALQEKQFEVITVAGSPLFKNGFSVLCFMNVFINDTKYCDCEGFYHFHFFLFIVYLEYIWYVYLICLCSV